MIGAGNARRSSFRHETLGIRHSRAWYTLRVTPTTTAAADVVAPPQGQDAAVSARQFVSFTAHEMQVPISVLGWNLDRLRRLLGEAAKQRDVGRVLERLIEANLRLTTLVEDLLNLSKLQEGAFRVTPRPVQLTEVVRRAIRSVEPEAERRGITVQWTWKASEIPLTRGDPVRLYEVVLNLLSNGVKYTPRGGTVTVSLRPTKELAPPLVPLPAGKQRAGAFVGVAVEDTGIGIPKEEQPKVFQQFFRGRKALAASEGGTGLGLYLVRTIVEQHGGMVWFASREGHGTTFFFSIPVADAYAEENGAKP